MEIKFEKQKEVPIIYHSIAIDVGLRLDIFVEDLLKLELKAHENYQTVLEAQLLSYMKINR